MAACISPYNVKHPTEDATIPVPCGKCYECCARRASHWSFRLMQENKIADSSHFITLTYDTRYVPITSNGFMGLRRIDLQLFFKRLRSSTTRHRSRCRRLHKGCILSPIKYFAVGEYGETKKRPHYHIILFNAELELIQPAWGLGDIHYGKVEGASVGYTLKYITKGGWQPDHRNDDRERPKYQMSKGLGKNYLTEAIIKYHRASHENFYCTTEQGQKISIPRYYKDKIWPTIVDHYPAFVGLDEWENNILSADQQRKAYGIRNFQKYIAKLEEWQNDPNYTVRKIERDKQNIINQKLKKKIDIL